MFLPDTNSDAESSASFTYFHGQSIRIGTTDLRIVCIAITHDATHLTRNTDDFAQVPPLPFLIEYPQRAEELGADGPL
jgi:predicted nucleic acid-binding protein